MNSDLKKISDLIKAGQLPEAEKNLKRSIDPDMLSDPDYIEEYFKYHIHLAHAMRHFLKYLKVSKVPPNPIDTKFDEGRRFFYAIYIINHVGGMRLVKNYLSAITPHRQLEYRFLGGIYFFNFDFNNALKNYTIASKMNDKEFEPINDLLIFGNIGGCNLYLEDYESFEKSKQNALRQSNNHPSMTRIFDKYDIIKFTQQKYYDKAALQYDKCIKSGYLDNNSPKREKLYLKTLGEGSKHDIDNFRIYYKQLVQHGLTEIKNLNINPEKLLAKLYYLEKVLPFKYHDYSDIFDFKVHPYPTPELNVYNIPLNDSHFESTGNQNAPNYLCFDTEEYSINGMRGIGFNSEIRAIYYIIRSKDLGLSFETIASLVYLENDYAGLFLVKERIKQIIYRIKNHFKINIESKNYRAYIDGKTISEFYCQKSGSLRIQNHFDMKSFCEYYSISQSKAKKIIASLLEKKIITKKLVSKKNIYSY